MRTTRRLAIAAAIICLGYGAYQLGYSRAQREAEQAERAYYAELMSIASHLYLAARQGQTDQLRESLGLETFGATLNYERRVPESERSRLSADYPAAREIATEVAAHMGTNTWRRGQDGLWLSYTNGR